MARIRQVSEALAALLNTEMENDTFPVWKFLVDSPFAVADVLPVSERAVFPKLKCYVEPAGKIINEGQNQYACREEWMNMLYITVVFNIQPRSAPGVQTGILHLIDDAEILGEFIVNRSSSFPVEGETVRLVKDQTEHELFSEDFLRNKVFKSTITAYYG